MWCIQRCWAWFRFVCAIVVALPVGLGADTGRTVAFTVFGEAGHDWSGIYFHAEGESFEAVPVARYARSQPARAWVQRDRLLLYGKGLAKHGTADRPLLASVPLEESWDTVLLFLLAERRGRADGEGWPPFRILAMDDSSHALPPEHFVFFNATGVSLFGTIHQKEVVLPPGQSSPIDLRPLYGDAVSVRLGVATTDGFEPVLLNRLRFSPGHRTVVLLLPPRSEGSFRVQAVRIPQRLPEALPSDEPDP